MLPVMEAYAKIAAEYGHVNPFDQNAVEQFFESTLPSYDKARQQDILDSLLELTTGAVGRSHQSDGDLYYEIINRLHNLERTLFQLSQSGQKEIINVVLFQFEEVLNEELQKQRTISEQIILQLDLDSIKDDEKDAAIRDMFKDDTIRLLRNQ